MAANRMWKTLEQDLEADLEYRRCGHLHLAESSTQVADLEAAVARQRSRGLDVRMMYGGDLRKLVPAVSPRVLAGSYTAEDGFANPILVTSAFATAARRWGAKVLTQTAVTRIRRAGARVEGVDTSSGTIASRWVVNAAGAWSGGLSQTAGVAFLLRPEAHQMMVTEKVRPILTPVLTCLGRALSVKQMPQGSFVIGGGWPGIPDMAEGRGRPKIGSPSGSAAEVTAILPLTGHLLTMRVWNSLEAHAIDEVPVIGPVDGYDGYLLATGFSGHGFALAPAVGKAIAEFVTAGRTSLGIEHLNVRRFGQCEQEKLQAFKR